MNARYIAFIVSLCIGLSCALFTSENVIFQKTNEIYINDAHWFVTFIHDLRPFKNLINQTEVDLESTDELIEAIIRNYKYSNLTGYMETFKSLRVEVDLLSDTYKSDYDNFDEYQTLSVKNQRDQRSLIPIIGQLMSTLYGTVSEKDLENINRNIKSLASNQNQIIHDLDMSLSVLNLTRMQVTENRRSIMDLIVVIQKLDRGIMRLQETFYKKFIRLEQFVHTYLQMILDEIKLTTQDAVFYLENLMSELNMLSLQHLATNTISPKDLRELLIEVESKLPNNFELPRKPGDDIWFYYKTLTCLTYLQDNEIRIVLKIPLINTKEEYDIFKVHNMPLPVHHNQSSTSSVNVMVKYELETEMFMISRDKTRFLLLSENNYHMCNSYHLQFCNPETAFYPTNVNKLCITALYMQMSQDIQMFCKQTIVLNQKLPITKYIASGVWIVVTHVPLTFTISCQVSESRVTNIKITPPVGIVWLNNTCKATNKYLQLQEYSGKNSIFERSDPLKSLLKLRNISQFVMWETPHMTKLKRMKIPSHLIGLKEIPVECFVRGANNYEAVIIDNKNDKIWKVTLFIIITVIILLIIIIICLRIRGRKCLRQIICKKWANVHDCDANVKQSPAHGAGGDVEMSVLLEDRNVNHEPEGQVKTLRQTDAMLAWAK